MTTKIELYHGDCLNVMDELIAQGVKVDAVITDVPYGTSACKGDHPIPFDAMWARLDLLIKDTGAIVLFGVEPFSSALRMSNLKQYKYDWIWNKDRGSNFLNFKYQPAKNYENIHVFSKGATSYVKSGNNCTYYPQMTKGTPYHQKQGRGGEAVVSAGSRIGKNIITKNKGERYPNAIQRFKSEKGLHPTQKPVPLIEYLIKTYTETGGLVLDFTMGSFTRAIACMNTKRSFIGIEIADHYFKVGTERVNTHIGSVDYNPKVIYYPDS